MTSCKNLSSKKNQNVKDSRKQTDSTQDNTLATKQNDQGAELAEKLAIPTQKDTLATETAGNLKQAIEQARAIPQGLIEKPTQASSSDLNIKDGVEASKTAVSEIQREAPIVKMQDSFLDSLKEKHSSGRSSLTMSGIQAQWQSHWEVKKCFEEMPFSDLRGCIWN